MHGVNRRELLKTTGSGAGLALVAEGAGAQTRQSRGDAETGSEDPEPLTTFQATDATGYLAFDTETPEEDALEFGGGGDGSVELEGVIFSDWTWESTSLTLPPIDLESLIEEVVDVPSWAYDVEVDMVVEEPIEGAYNPESGLVTAPLDVTIEGTAEDPIFGVVEIDAEVDVDATLTSGESNNMSGEATGLTTETPSIRVVANDYYVAETESLIVNQAVGLPSLTGHNWAELDLEISVDDPDALDELVIDPVVGETPPGDLDSDGLYEDVAGTGAFTGVDVMALFEHLDTDPVQEQAGLFLFAGGDRNEVRIVDVQALQHGLTSGTIDPPDTVVPVGDVGVSLQTGTGELPVGETATVDVVVDGATDGIGAFDIAVSLSGEGAATITDFEHSGPVVADGTHITDGGTTLILEGATLDEPYNGAETLTLTTLTVEATETGPVTAAPVIEPFPRGLFTPDVSWYDLDASGDASLTVVPPVTAEVAIEPQESTGDSVVVTDVDPGNHGEHVGIWTVVDGEPDTLRGLAGLSEPAQGVTVELDEPLGSDTTVAAAVHPEGESGPDTGEILDSDTATVTVVPTTGTLAGTVTGDGEPLGGITVEVQDRSTGEVVTSATTEDDGGYGCTVSGGIYDVVVNPDGFESASEDVAIVVEETSVVDFDLSPVPDGPPALPGFENPPQDLDGDGKYEDIDGDGTFDIFDVQALFDNLGSDAVTDNPDAFDFNGDGQVDIFDVQYLYKQS